MKFYQVTDTNQVIGYEDTDIDGIDYAISQGWQDVTNEYPQPVPFEPVVVAEPTKNELLAELELLTAKIKALS